MNGSENASGITETAALSHQVSIIVNARKHLVSATVLSFEKIVELAFNPPPTGENVALTVTYRNGPSSNPEGSLIAGETVQIADGMVFNVTATDKS